MKLTEKQAGGMMLLVVATPLLLVSILLGLSETEFGSTHIYWAPCPSVRCEVHVDKGLSPIWFGMTILLSLATAWGISMVCDSRIDLYDWGEPERWK